MTAMIVEPLASQFIETLTALAVDEVMMLVGVTSELRRLEKKVRTIRNVLEDAERKAFTNTAISNWLAQLKDVVYDADDVVDRCRIHAQHLTRLRSSDQSVRCCLTLLISSCIRRVRFRHQIGSSIRDINERLERITKEQSDFNLIAAAAAATGVSSSSRMHRWSDPILEPDIVGMQIETDTNYLVSLLTRVESGGPNPKVSVLAIAGMGGIGKTTLAQKIYNHPTIKDSFQMPPPMWVCVSKEYNETNLLKEVIRSANGSPPEGDRSFAELKSLLVRVIEGKKFFLILDDVWTVQVWEDLLRKPLQRGAHGSKVLITTRDERVAMQMGAVHVHAVQPLSTEDSWDLLQRLVFQGEGGDRGGIEVVGDIARQIAKKCGGLPLAIKTIAGVLNTKDRRTRVEWERVLENPAWSLTDLPNGVMGVLYLSFQDLPSHLKQCFLFCSLNSGDFVLMKHTLVHQWIAEGFIKEEEGDSVIMEEVAQGYYKELIRRNLLQPEPNFFDFKGCTLHDLLRSLAQFLARDENFSGDVKGLVVKAASASSTKLRRVSIVDREMNTFPEVIKEQKSLRTLMFMCREPIQDVPQDAFEKLGRLRLLDMNGTRVCRLPESVCNLAHLRYLDLSDCQIAELPELIADLGNLQYLILQGCKNLQNLPEGISRLYNLRSLDLLKTPVRGMPKGIGRLKHMNRLIGFVTNESSGSDQTGTGWCSLEELHSLAQLRVLIIENLERALIRARARAEPRGFLFRNKHHYLVELFLRCTPVRADGQPYGNEEMIKIQEMFEEELSPPPTVETFVIDGFFGRQFPSWIMTSNSASFLSNVRALWLLNCRYCRQVPPLGLLPNMDKLSIEDAFAVERIGPEFMGINVNGESARAPLPPSYIPFLKLEKLDLVNMPNLTEWQWEDTQAAMPRLSSLKIIDCPKLTSLPRGLRHATALTTLTVQSAPSLSVIENLVSLKTLSIADNINVVIVSNLPALQTLQLKDKTMESLPEWLLQGEGGQSPFPVLERLDIVAGGTHVLHRCLEHAPDWPKIQNIPRVYIKTISGPEFVFYRRNPFILDTNLGGVGGGSSIGGSEADYQN